MYRARIRVVQCEERGVRKLSCCETLPLLFARVVLVFSVLDITLSPLSLVATIVRIGIAEIFKGSTLCCGSWSFSSYLTALLRLQVTLVVIRTRFFSLSNNCWVVDNLLDLTSGL